MKVLVVDDNATSQVILVETLESFSFEASAVSSGEEALEELIAAQDEKAYDLVLLDWKKAGIDGIQTATRIDMDSRLSSRIPKIIMIPAFGTEEVKRQADEAGLDGFLAKPVQPSQLLDTVMDVFGKVSQRPAGAAQAKVREAEGADSIRGARILVAEDNEINQQVAREILEYEGASVQLVWNGEEAIEVLNRSEFDAVLMDVQMPIMDGYGASRLIRSDNRFKNLPIIAMTAHAMAGDREKPLEAGMNDHIAKPIDADDLIAALAKWIRTPADGPSKPKAFIGKARHDDNESMSYTLPGREKASIDILVQELYESLERKNVRAMRIAHKLAEAVKDLPCSEKVKRLQTNASELEFDEAGRTLLQVAEQLGVSIQANRHGQ